MVIRKPHKHDRRSWLVVLSEEGKKMFEQHSKFHEEFTQEISHDLSSHEIETLSQLMGRILHRM